MIFNNQEVIKKYGIAIYFFFLVTSGFFLGYLGASTNKQIGSFDGKPVYAKINGSRLEVSFSKYPMGCKLAIDNCVYIPIVIELNKLKLQ